ncbi:MAG: hypothetical protein Sapg2KO_07860 [Saprospiraceae bacterium]
MQKYIFYVIVLSISLFACSNPPEYPLEPIISYRGLSTINIPQSSSSVNALDTMIIRIGFTDGDGDLGDQDSINIWLTDSRDGFQHIFKINEIPELGSSSGISGEIAIKLTNSPATKYFCCTFPNTRVTCVPSTEFPVDTMSYSIRVRDRAGNFSNAIQTETFNILCQ